MTYDDLLNIRYKTGGRSKSGMDCWGVVMECTRRAGHPLPDLDYTGGISKENLDGIISTKGLEFGLVEVQKEERREGDIIQCSYSGNLHSGYLVSRDKVLHATFTGVRVSPLSAFTEARFFRGKEWS